MKRKLVKEAMKRFDILERKGLSKDVREGFKEGTVCVAAGFRFPSGMELGVSQPVSCQVRFEKAVQMAIERGCVPYYAVYSGYKYAGVEGEILSVFVISDNDEDSKLWDEEREALEEGYAFTFSQNLTYDFGEFEDIAYKIVDGVAVRVG